MRGVQLYKRLGWGNNNDMLKNLHLYFELRLEEQWQKRPDADGVLCNADKHICIDKGL